MSCDNTGEYRIKGEEFAKQLDELVEKQDTAGVLALDQAIRDFEKEIIEASDSAALAAFQEALKDARVRNTPFITTIKIKQGTEKDDALKEVANDALQGGVDLKTLTNAIDASLEQAQKDKK
jgi:hypothetical protein